MRRRGLLLPAATAFMAAAVLFALAGFQVTSQTAGPRLLGRLGAALIEIDRWLPEHQEDLGLAARDRPQGVVRVSDVPVPVALPAQEVTRADEAALRRLITQAMGDALYEHGNDAFRDNEGVRRAPGVNEVTHWAVLLLSDGAQGFWRLALPGALLILVVLCVGLVVLGRTPLAPTGAGAGFAAIASLAVWFLAGALNEASTAALDKEIALILRDGAWIGVRNALAVASSALGLMVLFRTIEAARLRARPVSSSPPQEIPPI